MNNQSSPEQNSEVSPASTPPIEEGQPVDPLPAEPATAEQLTEVEKQMTGFEKATLRWARIAVVLSALAAIFVCAQWYEMHTGAGDTHALAVAAGKQSEKMSNMSDAADKIRQAAENMVTQDQRIADDAQKSLDAAIAQNRFDQRPWVTASSFQLSAEPTLDPKGITVTVNVINTGKTPALDVTPEFKIDFSPSSEIPVPAYILAAPQSRAILAPGITTASFTGKPLILKESAQIDAYGLKTHRIWFQALIQYKDTFNRPHWTKVCAYHYFGQSLNVFEYCDRGNTADTEENAGKNRN